MPATTSRSSFVLNCRQKNDSFNQFLRQRWEQRRGFNKNSLSAAVLKYISQNYHFQYDGSAVFECCTKILKMMQKADCLILAILSETTPKAIVQKNIICEQLMSSYKFLS